MADTRSRGWDGIDSKRRGRIADTSPEDGARKRRLDRREALKRRHQLVTEPVTGPYTRHQPESYDFVGSTHVDLFILHGWQVKKTAEGAS